MFIREIKKKLNKKSGQYEYVQHRLVESIRTENGPRQHTLLHLGTLSIPQEHFKTLANLIEAKLTNCAQESLFQNISEELIGLAQHYADIIIQKRLQIAQKHIEQAPQPIPDKFSPSYETIDTNSIITSRSRTIGPEHIALTYLKQLDFFTILQRCSFSEKEQKYAAAQICARMIHPASERETARWLRQNSALAELLDSDFSHISDQHLHRLSDMLFTHKDDIEKQLCQRTNDLFSLDNKIILYDLTNTHFESPKRNSAIANYGKNKQKRNDCPQITLALVVDCMGFPKRSKILKGNVSEPGTLWNILEELDDQCGSSNGDPRTIVIDAGIATEENLQKLRADERFEYVAISRKKKFQPDIFSEAKSSPLKISHTKELLVKTAKHNDETFLLCKSPDRRLKDEAIISRRREKFEQGLKLLHEGLKKPRTRKDCSSVYERIGRLKERYKIGNLYTVTVTEKDGKALEITWKYHADKTKEFGEYIIRTSRNDLLDEDISLMHRTLTMIESAFRWLKSSLGLRPNFHQIDRRMSTHASISVLAYFALAPILNKLEWGGTFVSSCSKRENHNPWDIAYGWKGLVETMSSQTRVTTSFDCKDGSRMDVRTTLEPSAEQLDIYRRLNVNPRPLKRIIVKK
jgi:transposase